MAPLVLKVGPRRHPAVPSRRCQASPDDYSNHSCSEAKGSEKPNIEYLGFYIYIYTQKHIERDRERERERDIYIYICTANDPNNLGVLGPFAEVQARRV